VLKEYSIDQNLLKKASSMNKVMSLLPAVYEEIVAPFVKNLRSVMSSDSMPVESDMLSQGFWRKF